MTSILIAAALVYLLALAVIHFADWHVQESRSVGGPTWVASTFLLDEWPRRVGARPRREGLYDTETLSGDEKPKTFLLFTYYSSPNHQNQAAPSWGESR